MSRLSPWPGEMDDLTLPCPRCGASPGDWCSTASGRPTRVLHVQRFRLAAWSAAVAKRPIIPASALAGPRP